MGTFSKTFSKTFENRGLGAKSAFFEPELTTYMEGLTTPLSSGQKTKLNDFIQALKTGLNINALSDAFDVMYIYANETAESSLRNLVKRAHDATAVNSPQFTALEGFTGNGISSYLNLNYNPSAHSIRFTLNNNAIGVYSRSDTNNSSAACGGYDEANSCYLILRNQDRFQARINNPDSTRLDQATLDSLGMHIGTRNSNLVSSYRGYKNKTTLSNTTGVSNTTTLLNLNMYSLGFNNQGNIASATARQQSFEFWGRYISEAERNIIVDAFETYMDSNGKGVIA